MTEVLYLKDPDGEGVITAGMIALIDSRYVADLVAEGVITTDPDLIRKAKNPPSP